MPCVLIKRHRRETYFSCGSNCFNIEYENIHKEPTAQKFKTPRHKTKRTTTEV